MRGTLPQTCGLVHDPWLPRRLVSPVSVQRLLVAGCGQRGLQWQLLLLLFTKLFLILLAMLLLLLLLLTVAPVALLLGEEVVGGGTVAADV